eukprot:3937062-Rhodomonas_salina.1
MVFSTGSTACRNEPITVGVREQHSGAFWSTVLHVHSWHRIPIAAGVREQHSGARVSRTCAQLAGGSPLTLACRSSIPELLQHCFLTRAQPAEAHRSWCAGAAFWKHLEHGFTRAQLADEPGSSILELSGAW